MAASRPHVVIVGGGFAGLYAARRLAKAPVDVTLIDRRNHHLFQPLLYQVASAALNPGDIAQPIRSVLRGVKNCRVLLAEARDIDTQRRVVALDSGELSYDFLVLATGATHSYFGHEEWAADAPGLKTVEDALEIRKRVLFAYEAAEREEDEAARRAWMTFVVVGAGATGVEMAGALSEISRRTLATDFRRIDTRTARVLLLEGAPRVLTAYPEDLSEKARRSLEKLGVEVRLGAIVSDVDDAGVTVAGERIEAKTVIWAAGVRASSIASKVGAAQDRAGRIVVGRDLTIDGHPEIFAVGDVASFEQGGRNVFGVAPAAIQAGKYVADAIIATVRGAPRKPFRYLDKGSLATIGRKSAVADMKGLHLTGFVAWVAWLFIHVMFLIGFRNRLIVMFQWAWSYLTFQRGARLITGRLPAVGGHPSPSPVPAQRSPSSVRRA